MRLLPAGPVPRSAATGLSALAAALLVPLVLACGPQRRSEPLQGPLLIRDSTVAIGERAFSRECHSCHPRGEAGVGPALNDKPLPEWAIRLQVRQGFGAMPPFPPDRLDDQELEAIIRYMKALRAMQ